MSDIEITYEIPPVNEYIELRIGVGWGALHEAVAQAGLKNSIHQICIREKDLLIGYGRLFETDDSTFYIQDIIVKPSHQGKGFGLIIMEDIMRFVKENLGKECAICLLASPGKENFYKKFGFMKKSLDTYNLEMIQVL